MVTRRQLLVNGIVAGAVPFIIKREPIANRDAVEMGPVSAALGVHATVLRSVLDRFHKLLPQTGAIIYGNRDRTGACSFEVGGIARLAGHWRLDSFGSHPFSLSLASAVGIGCPRLAARLSTGAALRYQASLHMGGLIALLYEGFEMRICLLSRQFPDSSPARALFINS